MYQFSSEILNVTRGMSGKVHVPIKTIYFLVESKKEKKHFLKEKKKKKCLKYIIREDLIIGEEVCLIGMNL